MTRRPLSIRARFLLVSLATVPVALSLEGSNSSSDVETPKSLSL